MKGQFVPAFAESYGILSFDVVYVEDESDYFSSDKTVASCPTREAQNAALRLLSGARESREGT